MTRSDEDLLLDLLNTTPVLNGKQVDELVDSTGDSAWVLARGGAGTPAEIASLRAVRDAIGGVIRGVSDAQSLAAHLEAITLRPKLRDGALAWEVQAPVGGEIGARAVLAWAALEERSRSRLRPCANPECCRFLLDRSNANTARWCSMAVCGNRAKARRHYQRQRADQ